MTNHVKFMGRCLDLARSGVGLVAPNPVVGCVIVHNGKIIGEGFHREYGGWHAEVHAVASVGNPALLKESIMYVSLEPCSHTGKTPPCADLIIEKKIPHVIVGTPDPFPGVSGKGIARLRDAGVFTEVGILEKECRELNKRFFTFHEKKRPYVILKWAQTSDGYIGTERNPEDYGHPVWISSLLARRLVHKTRTQEAAILAGSRTALMDNPTLTARSWSGNNPLRIVIDRTNSLPRSLTLFDHRQMTLVVTENAMADEINICCETIDFGKNVPEQILQVLYKRKIQSLIVEGGAFTLQSFIDSGLWDEAHIYTGRMKFFKGIKAPQIAGETLSEEILDDTLLTVTGPARNI